MAILSLTAERFTRMLMEDGPKDAILRMLMTCLVASGCYAIYQIDILQVLIVAFPELLLVNVAINLVIGSWTGLRLIEYYRFRAVARNEEVV
jgi:hypothetical protein